MPRAVTENYCDSTRESLLKERTLKSSDMTGSSAPACSRPKLRSAALEASRPQPRTAIRMGRDEYPNVWRSDVVVLGLMGVAPTDVDERAAAAGESHDQASVSTFSGEPHVVFGPSEKSALRQG